MRPERKTVKCAGRVPSIIYSASSKTRRFKIKPVRLLELAGNCLFFNIGIRENRRKWYDYTKQTVESLLERIAVLEKRLDAVIAENVSLRNENTQLKKENAELKKSLQQTV